LHNSIVWIVIESVDGFAHNAAALAVSLIADGVGVARGVVAAL
jgi:hypothetical protein